MKHYLNLPLHIYLKRALLWSLFDFDSRFHGFYFIRFLKRRKDNKAYSKLLLRRYEMARVKVKFIFLIQMLTYYLYLTTADALLANSIFIIYLLFCCYCVQPIILIIQFLLDCFFAFEKSFVKTKHYGSL